MNLILFDLPENARILSEIPSGQVKAQGTLLLIDELRQDDIILSGDGSGIDSSGTHTIPLVPTTPEGIIVLSFSPTEIPVTVEIEGDLQ